MDLILWRHAEAEDANGKPDSERELTKRGRKQAERMARWLRPLAGERWRILVSPAKRTLQTVKPLEREFEESEAVGLGATPSSILEAAGWPDAQGPVLVVGHQPTLGQVAARLLGGVDGDTAIRKGAIWWFTTRARDGNHETILKAVRDPD
jgi:phosphohistidine phosphatase